MKYYKVNSSKELFERNKNLVFHVQALGGIVQNDIILSSQELRDYMENGHKLIDKINEYITDVLTHIVQRENVVDESEKNNLNY